MTALKTLTPARNVYSSARTLERADGCISTVKSVEAKTRCPVSQQGIRINELLEETFGAGSEAYPPTASRLKGLRADPIHLKGARLPTIALQEVAAH